MDSPQTLEEIAEAGAPTFCARRNPEYSPDSSAQFQAGQDMSDIQQSASAASSVSCLQVLGVLHTAQHTVRACLRGVILCHTAMATRKKAAIRDVELQAMGPLEEDLAPLCSPHCS